MTQPVFLFDLDGVLIDSKELHWEAWQKLKDLLPELNAMDYERFLSGFGQTNDSILKSFLPNSNQQERMNWGEKKEEFVRTLATGRIELLPGMESFLQKLTERKIPKIIASSTPQSNLRYYLKETILGKYFDQAISGEEVAQGKPAPDIFIAAAKQLKAEPKSSIVLEDSLVGLQAGRSAGSFVIALATTHSYGDLKKKSDLYDLLYHSPEDLNLEEVFSSFEKVKK